jgi:hypothetical protein
MRSIENTLALWVSGLLSSESVTDWANAQIASISEPPQELFDLATYGPERCLKWAQHDFPPRPTKLSYFQEFSIRALTTTLDSATPTFEFADWASRNCMGEELSDPMVTFGYYLDHLLADCQDRDAAVLYVQTELPSLLPSCKSIAAPFAPAGV